MAAADGGDSQPAGHSATSPSFLTTRHPPPAINMTPAELQRAIKLDYALSDRLAGNSYVDYLNRVVIDSRPTARRFKDIALPFQWERANVLAPAVEYVAGIRPEYDGPLNFWWTLPKGSDKSSGVARLCNWLLGYSRKKLKVYVAAADSDQARIVKDLQQTELNLNPWLKNRVTLLNRVGWGKGGNIEFMASDAASAQGLAPDVICLDELVHWHKRDLFDAIYSARNKRPSCITCVTTNAGYVDHFAHEVREQARNSGRWYFYESPPTGHLASWMNAAAIAEDRKLLHPSEASRLLDNKWIAVAEDKGFTTGVEVDNCRSDAVADPALSSRVYLGIDYGPRRDRTAIALLHQLPDDTFEVARIECWHRPGGLVRIEEIESYVEDVKKRWPDCHILCDPYQMESSIQQWEAKRWEVERFEPRGGKSNYALAANLHSLIASRRIRWQDGVGAVTLPRPFADTSSPPLPQFTGDNLAAELKGLIIRPTLAGYRFDHKSGRHDDRAVAIGMAALAAVNDSRSAPFAAPEVIETSERDIQNLDFSRGRQLYGR